MVLQVKKLTKCIPGASAQKPILKDISFQLKPGDSLALTGESGSGKSTLLHLIAALDDFDSGEIYLDGVGLRHLNEPARADIRRTLLSIVFQQFNIIPSLNVADNISLHARLAARQDPQWERHITQRLGLSDTLSRYPEQLSGGQQQRVAIARALALKPMLLLADEPTGNLDEDSSERVLELMLELLHDCNTALFLVTHSPLIASRLQQHLHLSNGKIT